MATTAQRTQPKLREKVKVEITASDKGGHAGEWSARKAQMAVQEYKRRGGGYAGAKRADNHLVQWTREEWGTGSGQESLKTGERYLPKKAREALTDEEYRRTTQKKRADLSEGRQSGASPRTSRARPLRSAAEARDDEPKKRRRHSSRVRCRG